MNLDIILRTYSPAQVESVSNTSSTRICGNDDREGMILRCAMSLVVTINLCKLADSIKLTVLDDNSADAFVEKLQQVLNMCEKTTELVRLTTQGAKNSGYQQFLLASQCTGMVYTVEDDYLHEENALDNMLVAYNHLNQKYHENGIVLYPYDCAFRYDVNREYLTVLLYDGTRYWRQIRHVAGTMFSHSKFFKENFETLSFFLLNYPECSEDDSVNKLFENYETGEGKIKVFSPIPSTAYHLSYNEPALINTGQLGWRDLWKLENFVRLINGWWNYENFYRVILDNMPTDAKIIEVGSWMGQSTVGMTLLAKKKNKNVKIWAVDTWEGSLENINPGETSCHVAIIDELDKKRTTLYETFLLNLKIFQVEDDIIPIRKTSEEASKDFEDGFAELVIIDAAHDYDNVSNDIKHWLPKVKKGGILAGDDYNPQSFPGVVAAVKDYFGEGNYQVYDTTWWKIIE